MVQVWRMPCACAYTFPREARAKFFLKITEGGMLQIERRICAEPQPKHVRVFQHCGFDSKRSDADCHFGRGAQILSLHLRRPHGGDGAKRGVQPREG
nr:MAG TPA: hypothetical protein [Caudoviricetes sp.]